MINGSLGLERENCSQVIDVEAFPLISLPSISASTFQFVSLVFPDIVKSPARSKVNDPLSGSGH